MKLKINTRLLPLKLHFFLFQGCTSPILPFIIIVAMQLGIPVSVQGTIAAISLLITVLGKPFIAGLADSYPSYRKAIFLVTLIIMVSCYSSIWFIPPLKDYPALKGQVIETTKPTEFVTENSTWDNKPESQFFLYVQESESCPVSTAWDCKEICSDPENCIGTNNTVGSFTVKMIKVNQLLQENKTALEYTPYGNELFMEAIDRISKFSSEKNNSSWHGHLYQLEGTGISGISFNDVIQNISLVCGSGEWTGTKCPSFWHYWEFWVYVILLNVAQITFNTLNSFTDAIAVDSMEENDSYGVQRAFGSLGWGVMGAFTGLLVDLWSGSSIIKNYSPAFLVCFILGVSDIITSAFTLKVPKIGEDNSNVLKLLGPLLRQPRFFIACCFALFNGCFDGICTNFLFVLQDDIAQRTNSLTYLTFTQGFSLFVQCATEAPFMFTYDWFLRKLGVQSILSLVFTVYMLRMGCLALVGFYGPLWSTLVVELLNGPCFGLGYTVTVSYAALVSPPGTSTTVQSILNICFDNLGYALANFLGGILIDVLGSPTMFAIVGGMAAGVLVLHRVTVYCLPPPTGKSDREETSDQEKPGTREELQALNSPTEVPNGNLVEFPNVSTVA